MDNLHGLVEYFGAQQNATRRFAAEHEVMMRSIREATEPFQNMGKALAAQMAAVEKAARPFHESVERIRRQQEEWAEAARPMQEAMERIRRQQEAWAEAARPMQEAIERIRRQQQAWPERILPALKEWPRQMRKVVEYLFERGWYVGPSMTLPGTKYLARLIDAEEHEKVEIEIEAWAEDRIDDILTNVRKHFSDRVPIIIDAVDAHRSAKYSLSVPVLLAQADGIAFDSINTFLFRGKPEKDFGKLLRSLDILLGSETTLEVLGSV